MNILYKIKIFLLLILISGSLTSLSQNKSDSLEALLNTSGKDRHPSILNQLADLNKRDSAKSLSYSREALELSRQYNNEKEAIIALKNIGITYGYSNNYLKALEYLLESYDLAVINNEWDIAGDNGVNIGSLYYVVLSNYSKAVDFYIQSLNHYGKTDNKKGIASALWGLGITYRHEKKFNLALDNLFEAVKIYKQTKEVKELPKVYVNIGTTYKEMNQFEKAQEYLTLSIKEFEETKNERGKAHALTVNGDLYRIQKIYDKSLSVLQEALVLNEKTQHKNATAECLMELGKTYLDMKRFDDAQGYFRRAAEVSKEIHKPESLSSAYDYMATIYANKNEFENAFHFLKLHKELQDSIFSEKKSEQIAEMQTRFDTENKEKEIVLLKQEKALNQTYLIIAITILISISAIAFLIINRQKFKLKTERELAEKESQLMEERRTLYEAELRNRELSEQTLHDQLEFKNKELASYTLNLIQKNEILEDVKRSVEEIKNSPDAQVKQKLTSLVNMVNYSFNLDKDWENFKLHFEQVHQDFFKKLLEQYPDLSANDLKLCSLIKLNLDNRGIAAILNISQESAKVARHRLRKKLAIPAEQTLIAFLSTVD